MSEIEAQIRASFDDADFAAAATHAVEGYGSELIGFLVATMRSESDAGEVFSQTCEDMWRGLPSFAWRCSFRTWLYKLARSAVARYRKSPHNQGRRRAQLSTISHIAERVRSRTKTHLRSEVHDQFARLRETLDRDSHMLLVLRLNRQLSFKDIARVMSDEPLDDDEAARVATRMRKRFQAIKDTLRQRATEMGMLPGEQG